MISARRISLILAAVSILLTIDICIKIYLLKAGGFVERFRVVHYQTNDADMLFILDRKTKKPIWAKSTFGTGGKTETVTYFFDGRNVMTYAPQQDELPRFDVSFYGRDDRIKAVWVNRGSDSEFTERILYDQGTPRKEVWMGQAWHPTVLSTNAGEVKRGVVVDGKWQRMVFTNGSVRIEP